MGDLITLEEVKFKPDYLYEHHIEDMICLVLCVSVNSECKDIVMLKDSSDDMLHPEVYNMMSSYSNTNSFIKEIGPIDDHPDLLI